MINPSAPGWIEKYFVEQLTTSGSYNYSLSDFYVRTRETGLIYGYIVGFDTKTPIATEAWLAAEVSKIALLSSLHNLYLCVKKEAYPENFITALLGFYNQLNPQGFSLFSKIVPNETPTSKLEKIIDARVQTNEDIISKSFSHLITNALLFIDILAFYHYLKTNEIPEKYFKKTEEAIISIVSLSLRIKATPSKYDSLLLKLFETSVRYSKFSSVLTSRKLENLPLEYFTCELEKKYLVDLAGMALWSDGEIEKNEAYFLYTLGILMQVENDFVDESIQKTNLFIETYKNRIPYFNYSNPAKHFYNQTTQTVITLIGRNKKRLLKEVTESKELMLLLAQSTQRDLNEKEKKKIRKQLLDVFKTIPSLAIFLLPGGSLLLPIFIKFIPKLLPSAFNENLSEDEV